MTPSADRAATFEIHRPRLAALAYRMLGVRADAEDIVQEAFVRWEQRLRGDAVRAPDRYLTRLVTHLCVDELRSARRRRETYVGEWLPEPVVTGPTGDPAHRAELADSLSMAFLRLLETLSPAERAVFLLREVFQLDYPEVAEAVGVTVVNCRQIARRARDRVREGGPPRFDAPDEKRDRIVRQFERAVGEGDLDGLKASLAEDVALYADGGGKVPASGRPLHGADEVAAFVFGLRKRYGHSLAAYRRAEINGEPGLIFYKDGRPGYVWSFHVEGGRIRGIYVVGNPDKLGHVAAVPE